MKIDLYLDTYNGQTYYNATNQPGMKGIGMRRFKITVELPDLHEPDAELAGAVEEDSAKPAEPK